MSKTKLIQIDPKELMPVAFGFAIGLGIIVFFLLLAKTLGMATIVDHSLLPRQ